VRLEGSPVVDHERAMALPSAAELERVLIDAVDHEADSVLVDRPDWVQIRTPSSPRPNHNIVLRARLAADEVEAKVAEVAADHRARGAGFRWFVGPSSDPAGLGPSLLAAGLQVQGVSWGMAMEVPADDLPLGIEGLVVDEMRAQDVGEYAALTARAWGRPDYEEAIRHIARKAFEPPVVTRDIETSTRSWIARLDGEAIASSHLRLLPGIGYFQGCAVLPAFRGRGLYRALLHHRLALLRTLGIPTAVVWANAATSGRACEKLGFATGCIGTFYESR
jgi:GNAT superfamily N-acetyltransferase